MTELIHIDSDCEDCQKLKSKIREQVVAFKTMYKVNPTLNSDILVQNIQELIRKHEEIRTEMIKSLEAQVTTILLPANSNGDTNQQDKKVDISLGTLGTGKSSRKSPNRRNQISQNAEALRRSKRERRAREPSPYSPENTKRRKLTSNGAVKLERPDLDGMAISGSSENNKEYEDHHNLQSIPWTTQMGSYESDEYSNGPDEWSSAAELMGLSFDEDE